MNTANYKGLKKIELDVTKKLFKYIYNNINLNKVMEELDRDYSYFYDTENNIAFNIWLSLDYIHKDGKTFTEKFLEERSNSLSKKEKTILEERKDSYVSLFEIMKYDKGYVKVRDILTEKDFLLLEPELPNIVREGEYVFSRIGKSLDNYIFIGDINYLPVSSRPDFIKDVLRDFNITRRDYRGLTMKDYLKRFGLNLYKIYDETIFDLVESDGDLDFYNLDEYDEIDEFENYLGLKVNEDEKFSHITNLSNIVESYLIDNNGSIEDLPHINLNSFFTESIEDGFICVKKELLSYIKTLKLYFYFLSEKDEYFTKQYEKILTISKNPFKYIRKLNSYKKSFNVDINFSYYISDILNYDALKLLRDFDIFLIYTEGKVMELTTKRSHIKRSDLLQINEHLEDKTKVISKAPNQIDFVNINFFYHLALDLQILTMNNNKLYFNKKSMDYLLLEDAEKYILLFEYLSSKDFVLNILNLGREFSNKEKTSLLNILASMKLSKKYSSRYFSLADKDYFSSYGAYFKLLGLIDYNINIDDSIKITSLGKRVTNYMLKNNDSKPRENIINLIDFLN